MGQKPPPITVMGSQFTEEVISRIQSASSGTIIEFSDVKVQSIAGRLHFPKPVIVRIQ